MFQREGCSARWGDVERKIIELGDDLQPDHVCGAFNSFKRHKMRPPDVLLDSLSLKAVSMMERMEGGHLISLLVACAKLKYSHQGFLASLIDAAQEQRHLNGFSPLQLTCCVYSVGCLFSGRRKIKSNHLAGFGADPSKFPRHIQFLFAIAEIMILKSYPEMLTPRQLAAMYYGLALAHFSHYALLNALSSETARKERLDSMNEQEVSMIVYSLGILRHRPKILIPSLLLYLSKPENLRGFREQGLCMTIYGVAVSGIQMQVWSLRSLVWETCRPHRLKLFRTHQLATILYSLGILKVKNPRVYEMFIAEISKPERQSRDRMKAIGLVGAVVGIKRAHVVVPPVVNLVKLLTDKQTLLEMSEQGLSNIVYSIGLMSNQMDMCPPTLDLQSEIGCPERLEKFSEQHLANILYGLCQKQVWRKWDKAALDAIIREVLLPDRISSFKDQGLANVVHSLAQMRIMRKAYHDLLAKEIIKRIEAFTNIGLAMIVYSWGSIGFTNDTIVAACCKEVVIETRLKTFTEQGLSNVMFGLVRMGCRDKVKLRLIMTEIERRVLPKFKFITRPELIVELLQTDFLEDHTRSMLRSLLRLACVRFKSQGTDIDHLLRLSI